MNREEEPGWFRNVRIPQLEARIRELEAECDEWKARWEEAGATVEHLQARVAELERMEEFWHNLAWLHVPHDLIEQKLKNPGDLLPPDMREE